MAEQDTTTEELEGGWVRVQQPNGRAPYYWHKPSGETSWTRPLGSIDRPRPADHPQSQTAAAAAAAAELEPEPGLDPEQDRRYFDAYGHWWKIHRDMLSDRPRMEQYAAAIEAAADQLQGKVVVDVGAGTGVLSLLVAQRVRPARVFAIEASAMVETCRRLVAAAGLQDVVTVVEARVEELVAVRGPRL